MTASNRPCGSASGDRLAAFDELTRATVRLVHRLRHVAGEIHASGEPTAARRGVMLSLAEGGPQAVPALARARPVSRQHIQAIVNQLEADGLVERIDNPAHQRSKLIALTAAGRDQLERMRRREQEVLAALAPNWDPERLRAASAAVDDVNRTLSSRRWRQILKDREQDR